MKKFYLRVFSLSAISLLSHVYAQEMMVRTAEEESISFLSEAVSDQKRGIVAGLDSLKKWSAEAEAQMDEDSLINMRMRQIQRTIPLVYNDKIKFYLDKYISSNYNPYMSKLQGLAHHYFPIFESIIAENSLPDEVKYLAVVESSLDPHLVSTSGAVGLWQFMYGTAKGYDLTMDSNVDERKDPYAACYAACRYFSDAYAEFDDWLLALASYNCGRGAVRRAIQRSGFERPSFWELAPFLPTETQNYIPKYIAMTYALKYAKEYGIGQSNVGMDWSVKSLMLDKNVDLRQVAEAVNLSLEELKRFNPSYKSTIVNASLEKPRRLLLPQTSNRSDSLLYAALNNPDVLSAASYAHVEKGARTSSSSGRYKVRSGETISTVAAKFGVSVQNLRAWNGLTAKSNILGRSLIVQKEESARLANAPAKKASGPRYQNHTVRKGDTLSDIANKYNGSTVAQLKSDNNIKGATLQIGQKLKVRTL